MTTTQIAKQIQAVREQLDRADRSRDIHPTIYQIGALMIAISQLADVVEQLASAQAQSEKT